VSSPYSETVEVTANQGDAGFFIADEKFLSDHKGDALCRKRDNKTFVHRLDEKA
jgi:hypothetical protein